MRPSNNLKNNTPSDTYWQVQLVCMKVVAHNSSEPTLEYNQKQRLMMNQGSLRPFKPPRELQKYFAVSD